MLDVIGIGIGPFNLSLAALIEPTPLRALFLEKRDALVWHPGLALPNSRLQVSPLKDCVTLVDPTSPFIPQLFGAAWSALQLCQQAQCFNIAAGVY